MSTHKNRITIAGLYLLLLFLYSCGCSCNCTKGLTCLDVSVKMIGNDSLVLKKRFCQNYDSYYTPEAINDSVNQLHQIYPPALYSISARDTLYVYDKIRTKHCNGNPSDYYCECAK